MRLIDADALKEQIENFNCKDCRHYNFIKCRACQIDDALSYIEDAPTVGEWIRTEDRMPDSAFACLVTVWDNNIYGDCFLNILPYFVGWDGERWNDYDGENAHLKYMHG